MIKPSSANYPERVPSANEYYSLSIPDQNPPKRESAFQKASSANLANFSKGDYRGQPGQLGANNEFFDKHFGEAHDRKKRQQQEMKDQLVADLQVQMELKKERERREKAQKALEDHRAEERYLKELNKINEYSVAESKKRQPNLFAEGLNDNDIAADFRKEKEQSNPRSVSLKTIPREPEMHSVHVAEAHSISRPNPELSVTSKPPERLKINEVSFAGGKEQPSTYGHVHSVTGQPTGRDYEALGAAVQHHQPMPAKYQEYSQRVADFGVERMDEKKRELRMNTNLLYQQLIDLRVGGA